MHNCIYTVVDANHIKIEMQRFCKLECRKNKLKPLSIKITAKLQIMQREYKYQLDKSSRKFICPNCGKKRFVKYINQETNEYLANQFGRCDREMSCGYFKKPNENVTINRLEIPKYVEPTFHPIQLVKKSIKYDLRNNFLKFLNMKFGELATKRIVSDYKIGTAKSNNYGAIFWQIDEKNNVRGGKIIQYKADGHRTKYINWVHQSLLKKRIIKEFNLCQCLFGLHLINKKIDTPIAIVESEKTACIMSVVFPKLLWLACGSLRGLNIKKLEPIKTRKIILYPDTSLPRKGKTAFEIWMDKATEFRQKGIEIYVSNLLEKITNDQEKSSGYDLADMV